MELGEPIPWQLSPRGIICGGDKILAEKIGGDYGFGFYYEGFRGGRERRNHQDQYQRFQARLPHSVPPLYIHDSGFGRKTTNSFWFHRRGQQDRNSTTIRGAVTTVVAVELRERAAFGVGKQRFFVQRRTRIAGGVLGENSI